MNLKKMGKKHSRFSLRLLGLLLLLFQFQISVAQQVSSSLSTIKGVVTDSKGLSIIGANVNVKGAKLGVVTDFDGKYSIKASSSDVLVVSFIGFKTVEIAVKGKIEINIMLEEESSTLNEVVIVGVSMKKSDLTGAVVNVKEKTLKERPVTSINDALQGRAAGVFVQTSPTPGGNSSIRIRGNNSIQYGGNPIFVVDGIIMDNDFNLINLNDVASIEVLKDASATALYGSRGANGVVVVTTKRGKNGEGEVSLRTWTGIKEFTNENITLGAKDMYELRIDALVNSSIATNYFEQFPNNSRQQFINSQILAPNSNWFADYEHDTYKSGKNYNWLEQVSRQAPQQNHSLSLSGGSDKSSYFMSFGYMDEKGLIKESYNKRYLGRINAEQTIKKWLKVGTNTSYTKSANREVDDSVFSVARGANPLLPIERYKDTLFLSWGNNWDINAENPLNSLRIRKDRVLEKLSSSNFININPIKGLNLRSTFAIDLTTQEYNEYIPSDVQQAKRQSFLGRAIQNIDRTTYYQWDNSVTYAKDIGKHNISGLFSTSLSVDEFKYLNVSARDFPTDDFSYYDLGGAFDKPNFNLGSDFSNATLMSYLGRANYNYDNRYFATVTARYDGSSKFADGYKWGVFPSFALSWNVSNEKFMQNQKIFDLVKLRVGYGNVGNQSIPNFAFYSLYRPAFSNQNVSFNSTGLRGTEDLTWEKQGQFNVGLDLSLLNKRLTVNAEYFNIVNSNLLMRRSLSTLTGYSSAIENIGEMTNKGFELSVTGIILDKNDLKWDISANISADQNKITKLFQQVDAIYNFGGFTGTEIQRTGNFFLGKSLNSIYMLEFDRIIQVEDMDYVNSLVLPGKVLRPGDILPKDQQAPGEPGHGIINEDDRVIVGKQDPKFYGGFSSQVTWKGLSLNAVFTYSYGSKRISSYYEQLMSGTGFVSAHTDLLDRWTPTNPSTTIPRVTYDNAARFTSGETSWGIQDGSFLRLATLTVGYDLPSLVLDKLDLKGLRIYLTSNNLITWTKYKGYDPENGDFYPTSRLLALGVDFSF
jgi:TonB-dependent starch-binding outer membrane protein SusC